MREYIATIILLISLIPYPPVLAANFPATVFPLDNYSQDIEKWLPPNDPSYQKPLLLATYQTQRLTEFYNHQFSSNPTAPSPWNKQFVVSIINSQPGVLAAQNALLREMSNQGKSVAALGYGENFRPYSQDWLNAITQNIHLSQFSLPLKYSAQSRAIIVENTHARLLPTLDPHFYSYESAGQGYPFDNLQASSLWVGTPVYIIGETKDQAWSLVMAPSYIAWVKNDALARAKPAFIRQWQILAKRKLVAITHTQTTVLDAATKQYQLTAYVGTVFPLLKAASSDFKVAIPLKNSHGQALLRPALVSRQYADSMPLAATPANMARVLKTLQNRPYGWGNAYFYNDCSAELQNLYTPFGIWLPRNSSKQISMGKTIDMTAATMDKRLAYLMQYGHPLLTTVYIGGHIFLYLGNYPDPTNKTHGLMAMTYQNIWGLSPKDKSRRAIIGQAVFLPLLASYPEDAELNSLSNSRFFKIIHLDEWPSVSYDPRELFFQ